MTAAGRASKAHPHHLSLASPHLPCHCSAFLSPAYARNVNQTADRAEKASQISVISDTHTQTHSHKNNSIWNSCENVHKRWQSSANLCITYICIFRIQQAEKPLTVNISNTFREFSNQSRHDFTTDISTKLASIAVFVGQH